MKTKTITLCGLLSAASIVIMSIGNIIQTVDLTVAVLSGAAVYIARFMGGRKAALSVYAVTGLLSALLLPNKLLAVFYILFGGLYPIIKDYAELVKNKWLSFGIKFLVFNILTTAVLLIVKYILNMQDDLVSNMIPVYYLVANIAFLLYDFAVTLVITRVMLIHEKRRKK